MTCVPAVGVPGCGVLPVSISTMIMIMGWSVPLWSGAFSITDKSKHIPPISAVSTDPTNASDGNRLGIPFGFSGLSS